MAKCYEKDSFPRTNGSFASLQTACASLFEVIRIWRRAVQFSFEPPQKHTLTHARFHW